MKEYRINIDGQSFEVRVDSVVDGKAKLSVDGQEYEIGIEQPDSKKATDEKVEVRASAPVAPAGTGGKVTSPLPGIIVEVSVKEGQAVKAGDKVAVVEAMKMENDILSEFSGTVLSVSAAKGDSVLEGAILMTIGK